MTLLIYRPPVRPTRPSNPEIKLKGKKSNRGIVILKVSYTFPKQFNV